MEMLSKTLAYPKSVSNQTKPLKFKPKANEGSRSICRLLFKFLSLDQSVFFVWKNICYINCLENYSYK